MNLASSASSDFLGAVYKEAGLIGVVIVGLVIIMISYLKNERRRIEIDEKRAEKEHELIEKQVELSGILEQIKREKDSMLIFFEEREKFDKEQSRHLSNMINSIETRFELLDRCVLENKDLLMEIWKEITKLQAK